MKVLRERKYLLALLALLVVFAACKGESPTAPTAGGGGGGGTGGVPPVGATIVLTVSNANPLVNSIITVTATVTQSGNPVPNGTAVEFNTTIGQWTDTGVTTTIRTTTNGVATATLTSATPGVAQITAIVNNVTRQTSVTFSSAPTTPPTTPTAPTITSISPAFGRPEGGEIVTITGTNFRTPVRVVFDLGGGVTKEAFVASVTSTQVQVVTPSVNLGPGQTLDATILLFNEAGTPNEQRVSTAPFTFRLAQLTPAITTVSPDSGPVAGGTRITIFGSGFEAPVQVSFTVGAAFAQMTVISTTFSQIIAVTPPARDVNPDGSGSLVGPVNLRVMNINSATSATLTAAFRYTPKMQITGARPLTGTSLGGTDVTIDGIGFDDPVDVTIGTAPAQVLRVSGSQILARTTPLAIPCANSSGPITVTNIDNGDNALSLLTFQFIGVQPFITGVTGGPFEPGSTATVTVQDAGIGPLGNALIRFSIGGQVVTPTPQFITVGTGVQTFAVPVPLTGFTFPTIACTTAAATPGTRLGPVTVDVTFNNATTGCSNTLTQGITINPPGTAAGLNPCLQPPTASSSAPPCPAGVVLPPVAAAGAGTTSNTFTISNAPSSRDLIIGAPTVAPGSTNPPTSVNVNPSTQVTLTQGTSQIYTITVDPSAVGPFTGTITFTTNDPTKPTIQVCFSGSGT
jgi:hypothetical protein